MNICVRAAWVMADGYWPFMTGGSDDINTVKCEEVLTSGDHEVS